MKKSFSLFTALLLVFTVFSQTTQQYLNQGIAKNENRDYEGAIADFTMAIKIDPKNGNAYFGRGIAKGNLKVKDYNGAINDFTMSIKINPKDGDSYFSRGQVKYHFKDYTGAIADYTMAIEINPKDAYAYMSRGMAKSNIFLKDYKGAIADFNKAIEIDPSFAIAYFGRGGSKIAIGQKESACLDFSKAGELGFSQAYEAIKKYCQ